MGEPIVGAVILLVSIVTFFTLRGSDSIPLRFGTRRPINLEASSLPAPSFSPPPDDDSHDTIRVVRICRSFGPLLALNRISFQFRQGEICALLGPNGAGKTTLLRILASIDQEFTGVVLLHGQRRHQLLPAIRQQIGFVPDQTVGYPDLSVTEYLTFFAMAYGLRGQSGRERVREVLDFAGLTPLAERPSSGISLGNRQRLSLARAIIHDPDILLLDEPLSGLDPRARIEFRHLLVELAALGKAILFSSHILTDLSQIASSLVLLRKGRVIQSGSRDALLSLLPKPSGLRFEAPDGHDPTTIERFLHEQPGVLKVRRVDSAVVAEIDPERTEGDRLVRDMVRAEVRVERLEIDEPDLEDLYLHFIEEEEREGRA